MKTITSMVRYYFDNNAISQYATYENLYRSSTLIVRLPENVHIEGDYLGNIFEQNYIIGTINNFMKQTNIDNNGIMQTIYIYKFKWILVGSSVVHEMFENIIAYGFHDVNLCIDNMVIPIRIFHDARIEKRLRVPVTNNNSQKKDTHHSTDEKFDFLEKDIQKKIKAFEEITESDISNLYEENKILTKKVEELENLVQPLTEKLIESDKQINDLIKKIDLIKESLKWDTKFLYNRIDTLKHDMIDYVVEKN